MNIYWSPTSDSDMALTLDWNGLTGKAFQTTDQQKYVFFQLSAEKGGLFRFGLFYFSAEKGKFIFWSASNDNQEKYKKNNFTR